MTQPHPGLKLRLRWLGGVLTAWGAFWAPLGMTMLSVQSMPPWLARAHSKAWRGVWFGASRVSTSADQAMLTTTRPVARSPR